MTGKDHAPVLMSEVSDIEETRNIQWKRNLSADAPLRWLSRGWKDLWISPVPSLLYGLLVFVASIVFIAYMFDTGRDYFLFPALAGFLIVGPIIASGLYLKSRSIELGEPFSLRTMVAVRPKAGAQVFFTGMLLVMLILLWMRAAVLVYALFFGIQPFPGLDQVANMLVTTPTGWAMLAVGGFIGSLFAGFAFAISVFSIPMLLDRRIDAFTAMGISTTMVWNNLRVTLTWGAIVLALFLASLATGLLGLIVIFPWLGHATWHAYREMR
ncbi:MULTISPECIES: DUF2189 domain-containing protein [Alphaproteobacteria]|uniref:Cytochrome c oxidase subunit I n=2 Tax=Alphaproteobacteria TaxID=28211 RepID=A0A512HM05_9HYPH|nr:MULTISPECIES: DUF2189 domain-containing protein [Alphaproteobacteria]GEO86481.1 hypothetical protein RNA01_34130 [Ciceribacter naphthalenivorans]